MRKTLKIENINGALFPGGGKPEDTPELVAERWEDRITAREFPELCEQAGVTGLTFRRPPDETSSASVVKRAVSP